MNERFNDWLKEKKNTSLTDDAIENEDLVRFITHVKSFLFPGYVEYVSDLNSYLDKMIAVINSDLIVMISAVERIKKTTFNRQNVIDQFFNALPEVDELLKTDIDALYDGDPAAESKTEIILCYPGFEAIVVYRIAHILYNIGIPILPRALAEYAHSKTGIDINPGAKIGSYFFIDHGTGIVIGETCEIGSHVKIYQGVTLGALSLSQGHTLNGKKRHPTIKDNVTIYSGASIFGGDTIIGANSTIGSSAYIVSSVEDNMIVTISGQNKKKK